MASTSVETLQSMDSLFKQQYLEKGLQRVLPDHSFLMSEIEFVGSGEEAGKELVWPVLLSRVHGFTALGQGGENLALRKGTTAKTAQGKAVPYPFMGRTQISNVAISRATGGAQAFVNAVDYHVRNLQESFALMVEQELLYGQSGLGKVASAADDALVAGYTDSTQGGLAFTNGVNVANKAVLMSKLEWAEHVWIGGEGMPVDIFDASGAFAYSTEVTKVDTENRILFLESLNGLTDMEGYSLYRAGFEGNSGPGLQKILTHSSGTLFNINTTQNPLWRASQFSVGDNLSFEQVAAGVARAQGRGLDSKLTLHINPRVFAEMMPDFNTLKTDNSRFTSRMFTSSQDVEKLEHGMYGLKFIVGPTELVVAANSLIKGGFGFGIPEGYFRRTGSTDITYDIPGEEKGRYFHRLDDVAAVELRCYTDQALVAEALNSALVFTNIKIDD